MPQKNWQTPDSATIGIHPSDTNVEWDIYQLSVKVDPVWSNTTVDVNYNGFFLCGSFQGWKDCATGPPDIVVQPSDMLSVVFSGLTGAPTNTQLTVAIWYNENATGTTYSTAH